MKKRRKFKFPGLLAVRKNPHRYCIPGMLLQDKGRIFRHVQCLDEGDRGEIAYFTTQIHTVSGRKPKRTKAENMRWAAGIFMSNMDAGEWGWILVQGVYPRPGKSVVYLMNL